MENDVLFSEKQRFKHWLIWVLMIGINGFILTGIYFKLKNDATIDAEEVDNTSLVIVACVSIVITLMFFLFRLDTQIKSEGIYVRFIPFRFKYRHYNWEDLSKIYIREYSPLGEYGGWGIRYTISGAGKAYNISGKIGLQLEFTTGKKVLIGTQKGEEIKEILTRIGQYKA
jgi:heme/copper-type cytochrome/quinol oxidase subunit 4